MTFERPILEHTDRHYTTVSRLRPDMDFQELLTVWQRTRTPAPKSVYGAQRAVSQFVALVGNVKVAEITRDHLYDYRDCIASLPSRLSNEERARPYLDLVAMFAGGHNRPRPTITTVRKQVRFIQSLLTFAFRERWIPDNVGRDIPAIGASDHAHRRAFTRDEARAVFTLPLFIRPWSQTARWQIGYGTLRWLMLIGLTSGARIEEIGQLQAGDLLIEQGIICFAIDELDSDGRRMGSKAVKTESSRRRVPVHSDLLKLGLYERAQQLQREGVERLFPDLPQDNFGRFTRNASRCCNRLIDKVTGDPRLVFHSFRHFFKDLCREAGMLEYVSDQLTGHAPTTIGGRYGNGVSISELKAQLERLRFEFIDWERIYAASRL